MVLKLVTHFVATAQSLFLTFTAVLDPIGAIVAQIRSSFCSIRLSAFSRVRPLALSPFASIASLALPALSIVGALRRTAVV
jgi:hypothetical protein